MKFSERLTELGFATYADYLKSDHWLRFRRDYKQSGSRMTCLVCKASPIQLHHQTYVRIGRERFSDVVSLCRPHHEAVHEWLKTSGRNFVEYTHEAVAALGGEFLKPIKTPKKSKGKRRKRKVPKPRAIAADKVSDSVRPLVVKLFALPLTKKQIRAVNRVAQTSNTAQLAGMLKGFTITLLGQEAQQNSKKRKKVVSKQTPPLRMEVEAAKWKDPLYAVRMLASGHRPPPNR